MSIFPARRRGLMRGRLARRVATARPLLSLEPLERRALLSGLPVVQAVIPPAGGGTAAGGGEVRITGSNFDGATAVRFGTTVVTKFSSVTSSEITLTQPALPAGFQDVTVTTPAGTSAIVQADQYLVDPLTVTITNETGLPAATPIYVGVFAKMAYVGDVPANVPLTATGTAVMSGAVGQVGSLVIQDAGTGYAPQVAITPAPGAGGAGGGAKATEFDASGGVTTLAVTGNGSGYGEIVSISAPPPRPSVIPGTSIQATAYADVNESGAITQFTVTNAGGGYRQWFTFGTGGSQAYGYATVTAAGAITGLTVEGAGSGLSSSDTFSFPGTGLGAVVTPTVAGGTLQDTQVTSGGSGYYFGPSVAFIGGDGRAAATATVNAGGGVSGIALTAAGAGYGPRITVRNGAGLEAQAVISGNSITSIAIEQSGTGYAPTLIFSPPTGAGATAAAAVTKLDPSGGILAATVKNPGSGYTAAPTIQVAGAGTNAAIAAVGAATVTGVTITNPGLGYSSPPGLVFNGGGAWGPPAAGTPAVAAGGVTGVTITANGQYFSAPTVAFDAPPSGGYTEQWVGFNPAGQFDRAAAIKTAAGTLPTYPLSFTGGVATLQMPNLYTDSVRIVFGVDAPPVLPVMSDGSVAAPSMENPGDQNHTVFWDFVEYTLNQQGTLYIDTSAVDQFGIPISVTVDAPDPNVPGGVGTLVGRDTLFGTTPAMSFSHYLASVGGNATTAFGGLTTQQGSGTIGATQYPYRVLAPQDYLVLAEQGDYTGTQPPQALKEYFDTSLEALYDATGRTITLLVPNPNAGQAAGNLTNPQDAQRSTYVFTGTPAGTANAITFTGTVNGASVQLLVPAYASSQTPTTDVFAAAGIFAPGDTGQTLTSHENLLNNLSANIKNQIASAVNRGIANVTPASNPGGFTGHLGSGVASIAVAGGGSGYTAAPAVTIAPPPDGPNSAQAKAVAVMSGDRVTGVIITDPGNGYDPARPPAVTFSLPQDAGSRATAGAVGLGFFDTTAWVGTQTNLNRDHLPFYQPLTAANRALGFSPANFYAGYFHASIAGQPVSRNNLAYAFPYDDQGNQSSTMVSTAPRSVAITLTSWGATAQSPFVSAIDTHPPQNPPGTPTPTAVPPLGSVTWTVAFSEPMKGVTPASFTLAPGQGLLGTSILSVAPGGSGEYSQSWTVTANSGTGSGLLGLDMTSAAGVYDAQGHQLTLAPGGFPGQTYSVRPNPVGPTAAIAIAGTNPTAAATVPFTVTFSEAVTGLAAANFTTVATGGLTGTAVQGVQVVSGSGNTQYTVTVSTGSGSGTLALRLASAAGLTPAPSGLPVTSAAYTIDKSDPTKAPEVQGIVLAGPSPTAAANVSWTITFTEPVTGVTAANFTLATSGLGGTPAITAVTPASSTSTATWTVTASTGSGSGTLGLNMVNSTGVRDADSQAVTNVPFTGAAYTVDRTAPAALSIVRADASPTSLSVVGWTVTFSEAISGLSKDNFQFAATGLEGAQVMTVAPAVGSAPTAAWTVTAATGSGSGTLRLDLVNVTGITDAAGLPPTGIPLTGQAYTVTRGGATKVDVPISFMTTLGTAAPLRWLMNPFTDADSAQLTAALSATPGSSGTFRAASGAGVTVTPSGTAAAELTFTGTASALNAYFKSAAGRIRYTPTGSSLTARTLTLSAQGSDGLSGFATAALLVRAAAPLSPAPTVSRWARLAGRAGQPLVITYAQLVAATRATHTASRSVQFMLAGPPSGRLDVWSGGRWNAIPVIANVPLLAPGGRIRWTPPVGAMGVRPAFSVKAWDGWRMSGVSQVRVNLAR